MEDFHNAVLTTEETKAEIEKLPDPASARLYLSCTQSGINRNWDVRTQSVNEDTIDDIVCRIECRLHALLEVKEKLKKVDEKV